MTGTLKSLLFVVRIKCSSITDSQTYAEFRPFRLVWMYLPAGLLALISQASNRKLILQLSFRDTILEPNFIVKQKVLAFFPALYQPSLDNFLPVDNPRMVFFQRFLLPQ